MGYKLLVSKLSGFAKFELDTKINRFQFFNLIEELSQVEVTLEDPEGSGAITHGEPSHMDEQPPAEGDESQPALTKATRKVFNQEKYE